MVQFSERYTDIGQESLNLSIWHNITLVEITKRGCEFAVRTSKLRDYDLGEFCVWSFNINGILQFIIISMMYITECDYKWEFIIRLFFTVGAGITGDDIQVIIYMNCIEKKGGFFKPLYLFLYYWRYDYPSFL